MYNNAFSGHAEIRKTSNNGHDDIRKNKQTVDGALK